MSNHKLKVELWNKDPKCFWCKRTTKLICEKAISGKANPLMATIDHLVSRLNKFRWVQKKKGSHRKVLACYQCNHGRSTNEILFLSRAEILNRSRGFSLSPKGKPKIINPLPNVADVERVLKA